MFNLRLKMTTETNKFVDFTNQRPFVYPEVIFVLALLHSDWVYRDGVTCWSVLGSVCQFNTELHDLLMMQEEISGEQESGTNSLKPTMSTSGEVA